MFAPFKGLKERLDAVSSGEGRRPHRRPLGSLMSGRTRAVRIGALEEARRSGHDRIGTEHLLLGILAENAGEAATRLRRNNVRLSDVRSAVERLNGAGTADPKRTKWPNTPQHTSALFASEERRRGLGCRTIEPEHVLYGILRVEDATAVRILRDLGAEPRDLLAAL